MGLFGSPKGVIQGFVTRLNAHGPVAWITEVAAYPVEPNGGPLGPRATHRKASAQVECNDADKFEMTLPPGHYQLLVLLTPQVMVDTPGSTGANTEIRANPDAVVRAWPLPRALEVKKGDTRNVNLKVDCAGVNTALPPPAPAAKPA